MPKDGNSLYAARLNSFKVGSAQYWPGKNRITTVDLLERSPAGYAGHSVSRSAW